MLMNADMQNSTILMNEFRQKDHKGVISGIDLSMKVLRAGVWDYQQNDSLKLPEEMCRCCERFDAFFKSQHTGKNLKWIPSLGNCEVKSLIHSKPYMFILSTYQTAILMLYNSKDIYTYKELLELTKLPPEKLNSQLFNFIHPRMGRLLLKENKAVPNIAFNEKLELNKAFSFSSIKTIFIPTVKHRVSSCTNIRKTKMNI
jgi:hypothetical protein